MSETRTSNETGLMYMFFCAFLVVTNLITSTIPEISSHSIAYNFISTVRILIACGVHGFVFVEGYRGGIKKSSSGARGFFMNIKKLLVPLIATVIVYWFFLVILGEAELKPTFPLKILFGYHFYIVLVLLQFAVISLFAPALADKISVFAGIVIALVISLLSVTVLPEGVHKILFTSYLVCYTAGLYSGRNRDVVQKYVSNDFPKIAFFYVVSLIITESISIIYAFSSNVPVVIIKQLATGMYNPVAVIFVLAICIRLSAGDFCKTPLFGAYRRAGYQIFLWHLLPITASSLLMVDSEVITETGGFLIKSAATLLMIIIILGIFHRKERKQNGTI